MILNLLLGVEADSSLVLCPILLVAREGDRIGSLQLLGSLLERGDAFVVVLWQPLNLL